MNKNKGSISLGAIIIIAILVISSLSILTYRSIVKEREQDTEQNVKGINQDQDRDTFAVIGTGTNYNGGAASTTARNTIYVFASSTDETYWNTSDFAAPHTSGATTTHYFLTRNAEIISFNGVFKGEEAVSTVVLEVAGSNDSACNLGLSNTANWYPLSTRPATTSPIYIEDLWTKTITPGDTASTTFSFTLSDLNYDCLRVRAYNASTTDESLLFMEATIKE